MHPFGTNAPLHQKKSNIAVYFDFADSIEYLRVSTSGNGIGTSFCSSYKGATSAHKIHSEPSN